MLNCCPCQNYVSSFTVTYVMSVQQRPRYVLHCSLFAKIIKTLKPPISVVLVTSILFSYYIPVSRTYNSWRNRAAVNGKGGSLKLTTY